MLPSFLTHYYKLKEARLRTFVIFRMLSSIA